ncbi:MAG: hypothetical protein HRU20_16380 [Pseudomonadales bacterium]|nr:hypothetical protein [Pseudomonadales bacterium]
MEAVAVGSLLASGASAVAGAGTVVGAAITLEQVSAGFGIFGQVLNFFSGQSQADAAYDAQIAASRAELEATRTRVAENNLSAQRERTQAAIEEAERQRRLRRTLAAQRAAFAGGSIDPFSGSAGVIQDATVGEINRESRLAEFASQDVISAINTQGLGIQAAGSGRAASLIGEANTSRAESTQTGINQIGQIALQTGSQTSNIALATGALSIQIGSNQAVAVGASVEGTNGAAAGETAASAFSKAAAINSSGVTGLTATATTTAVIAFTDNTVAETNYDLNINGEDIYLDYDASASGVLTGAAVAAEINLDSSDTGISATFSGGNLTLVSDTGRDIIISEAKTQTAEGLGASTPANDNAGNAVNFAAAPETVTFGGQIKLSAEENIVFSGTGVISLGFASDTATIAKDTTTLSTQNVKTVSASEETILRVDAALTSISDLRSEFGAVQNRFESIVVTLQTTSENLRVARSRIEDADFAAETSKLIKAQILQEAGILILAQANLQPQSVLELLAFG